MTLYQFLFCWSTNRVEPGKDSVSEFYLVQFLFNSLFNEEFAQVLHNRIWNRILAAMSPSYRITHCSHWHYKLFDCFAFWLFNFSAVLWPQFARENTQTHDNMELLCKIEFSNYLFAAVSKVVLLFCLLLFRPSATDRYQFIYRLVLIIDTNR